MKQQSIFDFVPSAGQSGREWHIYVDGASRNNPGDAGAGIYIIQNDLVYKQAAYYLGQKTNNQAEYLALILALWFLRSDYRPVDTIRIFSDSQLLVRQIIGSYKVRDEKLKPLKRLIDHLLAGVRYTISHIMREDNINADLLANKGIDDRHIPPASFIKVLQAHDIQW